MDRKDAREKLIWLLGETREVYILLAEAKSDPRGFTKYLPKKDRTVCVKYDTDGYQVWTEE